MPPASQQIPQTPREAIQLMRDQLDRLETQPWVRDYQSVATMSSTGQSAFGAQTTEAIQRLGLGYTSLAVAVAEAAEQFGRSQRSQQQQQR
jgi:hypothetical protein